MELDDEGAKGFHPSQISLFDELLMADDCAEPLTLSKRVLVSLSHAIEDHCVTEGAVLFGAFQYGRYYEGSRRRWRQLRQQALSAIVFARWDTPPGPDGDLVVRVPLWDNAPLLQEWTVIVDNVAQPAALTALELPGQEAKPHMDRDFASVWTVRPKLVRSLTDSAVAAALYGGANRQQTGADALTPVSSRTASDPATDRLFLRSLDYLVNGGRGR